MDPWSNTATNTGNYPYLSFLSLFVYLSIFLCHSVSLSFSFSHYLIIQLKIQYSLDSCSIHENINEKTQQKPPPDPMGSGGETTRVTYGPLNVF